LFTNSCVIFSSVSTEQEQFHHELEAQRVAVQNAEAKFTAQSSVMAICVKETYALVDELHVTKLELWSVSDSLKVCSFSIVGKIYFGVSKFDFEVRKMLKIYRLNAYEIRNIASMGAIASFLVLKKFHLQFFLDLLDYWHLLKLYSVTPLHEKKIPFSSRKAWANRHFTHVPLCH